MDTCCCCIGLKTGCFILGYLGLVGIVVAMIAAGFGIVTVISLGEKDGRVHDIVPMFVLIVSVVLVLLMLGLVFNIVLLIGLHNNKRGYIKAYLIFNTILLIAVAVFLGASFLFGRTNASNIISIIVQIFVSVYNLLVIKSYYLKMKEPSNQTV